ncbi:transcription factor Atoh8 [Anopheles ziemanni]|uniref:transcription factor Atoh8 n=1 Tax=Anopheles coustani TaxID=139045 RepID=UPI0026583D47|nr:transcription factor Atoh8 [Anopheles coustani]XP_058166945.1 transcription factor Atoh8 [Anopheles ziemanni]
MWSEAMSTLAKLYPNLSEDQRAAMLLKGAAMSSLERDSGFNSGSSEHEEDLWSRDGLITPENASSEDSVPEAKLPACPPAAAAGGVAMSLVKNKRKSSEPLRVVAEMELMAPLKKRIRYDEERKQLEQEEQERERERTEAGSPRPSSRATASPFRPWAPPSVEHTGPAPAGIPTVIPNPADLLIRHPAVTTLHRAISLEQQQPLALVAKKSTTTSKDPHSSPIRSSIRSTSSLASPQHSPDWPHHHHHLSHHHPHQVHPSASLFVQPHAPPSLDGTNDSVTDLETTMAMASSGKATSSSGSCSAGGSQTRNYKNMTRERRIEANARERTRVHTISAAYEKLRKAVPAYSNAQKLSKLSILRIACSYILTLSRMAGEDYSEDGSEPSIADCVEMVTKTIQTEGKIRKKKDE